MLIHYQANETYYCGRANVRVLRRFRDEAKSRGRPNLGWCIDVRVIIREGKHHQIRRMAKRSGFHVVSLHRVSIASILKIESVPLPGQCRWLTLEEIHNLYEGLLLNDPVSDRHSSHRARLVETKVVETQHKKRIEKYISCWSKAWSLSTIFFLIRIINNCTLI